MFKTYTKGEAVVAKENDKISDKVIDVLTAPISFNSDEMVTKSNRAVTTLIWAGVAMLGGELYGHHRAAAGQQAFIPFFRP